MAAILSKAGPGDEIIMPSFTFSATATAFVLRGATPVFVDIRSDSLNIDEETLIEAAITPRTKAVVPVHYAGVACEMDAIVAIARQHDLSGDRRHRAGPFFFYKGHALGTIGDLRLLILHETKNVISGEESALILKQSQLHPACGSHSR